MSENQRFGPPPDGVPHDGYGRYDGRYDGYGRHGNRYGDHGDHGVRKGPVSGNGAPARWLPPPDSAPVPPHGHGTGPYRPCPGCPVPCSHPPVPRPGFPRQAEPQNLAGPILALSLSILLMVTCCGALGVVGTVFSSLALSERTDPEKFRRYTRNAWIANGVVLGLMLVFVVFVVTGSS